MNDQFDGGLRPLQRQFGRQKPESIAGIALIVDLPLLIPQAFEPAIGGQLVIGIAWQPLDPGGQLGDRDGPAGQAIDQRLAVVVVMADPLIIDDLGLSLPTV